MAAEELPAAIHDERHTSVLMDVSNVLVRVHKEQFGRGPTHARSHWAGPDALLCLMEDTLTPSERKLVAMGEHQRLRDTRALMQHATVREFCEPIEAIVGRKVRAFISGIDVAVDGLVSELFVFHPRGYDGLSRTEFATEPNPRAEPSP